MSRLARAILIKHLNRCPGQSAQPSTPFHTIYDASGKIVLLDDTGTNADNAYAYDGNGALAKWVQTWSPASNDAPFNYYLRSSVFGSDVLELDRNGAMSKEYVYSANGSKLAYLKSNEVIWIHSEPSGKETYEIKQDRAAKLKQTYDPNGVPATNNGYNGGGPCPVIYCNSQANSNVVAIMQMGYRGMEILMARRQAQLFQDTMFWLVSAGVFVDPTRPPSPDQLHEQNEFYRQGFGFNPLGSNETFYRNTGFWSSWNRQEYSWDERRIDGFLNVPGEYDPQFSGQRQTQEYEPLPDVATLREKLLKRLDENKGRCRKFLEDLLTNLGINKKVENLFDEVAKNGGYIAAPDVVKKHGAQAVSRYGKKSPHPIGVQALPKGIDKYASNLRVQSYISSIIHELIHRAGIESHELFGDAAFSALSTDDQRKYPQPEKRSDSELEYYFTRRFNDNCSYDVYAVP